MNLVARKKAGKLKDTIMGVLERRLVDRTSVHPEGNGRRRDLGAKVNSVADKVRSVDFGRIDFDDCKVLDETVLSGVENKRW